MDTQRFIRLYQGIAVSVVALIFCIIAVFGGVIPSMKKIGELVLIAQSMSQDNAALEKKISILESYDETELRDKLGIVYSAVPGDKDIPGLFGTVELVAAETGVTILDMSVAGGKVSSASAIKQTPLEKQLGTRILPFTVSVVGNFPSIQKFITLAPTVRRLMRIRSFAIQFPKNDKPLTVSLIMDAFYEPSVTALGGAGLVITAITDGELATIDTLSLFPLLSQATNAHVVLPTPNSVTEQKLNPFAP